MIESIDYQKWQIDYHDDSAEVTGKASILNGVLKVPIVLMAELVQWYHRSELPTMALAVIPDDIEFVPIIKPYKELVAAIADLQKLAIVINHIRDQILSEDDDRIVGWVKQIHGDENERKIKGYAYLYTKKLGSKLTDQIINGKIIAVSVDGHAWFVPSTMKEAIFMQTNIKLNNIAILPHQEGRCPSGICGLNMDQMRENSPLPRMISHPLSDAKTISDKIPNKEEILKRLKDYQFNAEVRFKKEDDSKQDSNPVIEEDLLREDLKMDEKEKIALLEKQLKDAQTEILQLKEQTSNKTIESLKQNIKDKSIENEALSKKIDDLQKEIFDAKPIIAKWNKYKEENAKIMDEFLVKESYSEEDLRDMCYDKKEVIYNALQKKAVSLPNPNAPIKENAPNAKGFMKPGQKIHDQKLSGLEDDLDDMAVPVSKALKGDEIE